MVQSLKHLRQSKISYFFVLDVVSVNTCSHTVSTNLFCWKEFYHHCVANAFN